MSGTVWVSTTSHRSRDRLRRLAGELGREYGSWPKGKRPYGCYYQVPARLAGQVNRIPGARVLKHEPPALFKRWGQEELGLPDRHV